MSFEMMKFLYKILKNEKKDLTLKMKNISQETTMSNAKTVEPRLLQIKVIHLKNIRK